LSRPPLSSRANWISTPISSARVSGHVSDGVSLGQVPLFLVASRLL